MSNDSKEVLAALQDFKTTFDLAKASAGNQLKSSKQSKDEQNDQNSEPKRPPPPVLEISPIIGNFLEQVSKTGVISHPWKIVKPLFLYKLDEVIRWYNRKQSFDALPSVPNCTVVTFQQLYTSILQAADSFKQAPFTVQRLCELICHPEMHYKRIDKFLNALEKNTLIVTTVDEMGRRLSTASETDLSAVDPQQTEKLLALFDWIHSTSTTTNGNAVHPVESSTKESTSATNQLAQLDIVTSNASNADSKEDTNAGCSVSLNSDENAAMEVNSAKRSISEEEEDEVDVEKQVNKRVKLDTEDSPQADSTMSSTSEGHVSPVVTPSQPDNNDMSCQSTSEESISQDSDTLVDTSAEELPLDSDQVATSTVDAEPTNSSEASPAVVDSTLPASTTVEPAVDVSVTEGSSVPESTGCDMETSTTKSDETSSEEVKLEEKST